MEQNSLNKLTKFTYRTISNWKKVRGSAPNSSKNVFYT